LNSLQAVPVNDRPNGTPGAFEMVGFASVGITLSGWNPRGTADVG
jgi:hypothetical protein